MAGANWGSKKDYHKNPIPDNFFNKIGEIANFIGMYLIKGGISVSCYKEKYGSVRVYCHLGGISLWNLCRNLPFFIFVRIREYIIKTERWLYGLLHNKYTVQYAAYMYKRAYRLACEKYPEYRLYIISGADYHELLCQAGIISVNELRLYGWKGDGIKNSWDTDEGLKELYKEEETNEEDHT